MSKKTQILCEPAFDYLLGLIMSKQLMPGEKISESKIAEASNISRTPIREAMRALANNGLITIFPNRFAQVTEFTPEMIRETGILRIAIDFFSIKLSLMHGSRADFLELRKIAEECLRAGENNDYAKRSEYDMLFHLEIAKISKNSLLVKFQEELILRCKFILLHYPNSTVDEKVHLDQHIQIADALLANKEDEALATIVDHLSTFYKLKGIYPQDFFNFIALLNG